MNGFDTDANIKVVSAVTLVADEEEETSPYPRIIGYIIPFVESKYAIDAPRILSFDTLAAIALSNLSSSAFAYDDEASTSNNNLKTIYGDNLLLFDIPYLFGSIIDASIILLCYRTSSSISRGNKSTAILFQTFQDPIDPMFASV